MVCLKKKVNKYPVLEISYGKSSLGGWKFLFWDRFFLGKKQYDPERSKQI